MAQSGARPEQKKFRGGHSCRGAALSAQEPLMPPPDSCALMPLSQGGILPSDGGITPSEGGILLPEDGKMAEESGMSPLEGDFLPSEDQFLKQRFDPTCKRPVIVSDSVFSLYL